MVQLILSDQQNVVQCDELVASNDKRCIWRHFDAQFGLWVEMVVNGWISRSFEDLCIVSPL